MKYNKSKLGETVEETLPRQSSLPESHSPPSTPLKKQPSVRESLVLEPTNKANSDVLIKKETENISVTGPIKRVGSVHSVSSGRGEHGLGRILLEFKYQEKRQRLEIIIRRVE